MRWRLAGLVALAVVVVATILFLARGALFLFIISLVLAELLYPLVVFMEERLPGRNRMPGVARIVSILTIYVAFAAVVAGILYVTIPPLYAESQELYEAFPEVYESARTTFEGRFQDFSERIPVEVRTNIEEGFAAGGNVLSDAAWGIGQRMLSGLSNAVTLLIGFAIVPFFLFYILKDREEVISGVYPLLPQRGQVHTRNVIFLVNRVVGTYVRAQLLSATILGVLVFVGLSILGVKYAAMLGLVAGLFGLIPIIGPLLGAFPGLLVTLASSPNQIVWVALVYVVAQLIENNVITPRVQGRVVRLNPAIIIAILVVSSEIAGLWGVIIGVPLVAAARDVFVYFHKEWSPGGDRSPPAAEAEEDSTPPEGVPEGGSEPEETG